MAFLEEEGEELAHGGPLLQVPPLLVLLGVGRLVYQLVVGDVVDLHVEHVYQLFDKGLRVQLREQDNDVRERHLVLFEYVLGDVVPALHDEIVEALFLLEANVLLVVEATGRAFEVILEEKIADLQPRTVKLPLDEHVYLQPWVDLSASHQNLDVCVFAGQKHIERVQFTHVPSDRATHHLRLK